MDAKAAAEDEALRLQQLDDEQQRLLRERHEKAVLRHKYARQKELLKQVGAKLYISGNNCVILYDTIH